MPTVIPTLSTAGFVTDLPSVIDRMFSYYLTSDYSQSNLFHGRVLSLQKQIQAYQHNDNELIVNVREELKTYLDTVVDKSLVDVATDKPNPSDPSRINLTVKITVYKDGQAYSLGRLIRTQNSKVMEIITLNNDGLHA